MTRYQRRMILAVGAIVGHTATNVGLVAFGVESALWVLVIAATTLFALAAIFGAHGRGAR